MNKPQPKLLSGGNPQIPKGYGEEPIRAYLDALPDWKQELGRQIDRLISQAVPTVQKAVKWNSPLYGMDGSTWFASFHCMNRYIKVAFHRGVHLNPPLPVGSKQPEVRYVHVSPDEPLDEEQFMSWVRQASELPGEKM